MYFEVGAHQTRGSRDYQEDYFQVNFPEDTSTQKRQALLVMADGMGGHAGGAVASQIVVDRLVEFFTEQYPQDNLVSLFRGGLEVSNKAIQGRVRKQPELQGMGCTLVGVMVRDDSFHWVSIGDSLLYLLRDGEVIRKNDDHSYGGYIDKLAAAGEPVPDTPGFTPRRNMLMSYINGEEIAMIDLPLSAEPLKPGDRIIIASDGLDTISTDEFAKLSASAKTAQQFAEALIGAVEAAGKRNQDNTTVIVADALGSLNDATNQEKPGDWHGDTLQPEITEDEETTVNPSLDALPASSQGPSAEVPSISAVETPPKAPRERQAEVDLSATLPPTLVEDLVPAPASASVPEPPAEFAPTTQARSKWLVPGAVAAVLILGVLGWFFVGGDSPPPEQVVQSPAVETDAQPAVVEAEPEPAPPPATATPPVVESTPTPRVPERLQDRLSKGGDGPLLTGIAAGRFTMGSPDVSVNFDERPSHEVRVAGFAIGIYEVTFAEYDRFAQASGRPLAKDGGWGRDRRPVINVSWHDAKEYCTWLSRQTGETYRLPTEAEWEYAARAGSKDNYWWGYSIAENQANCWGCGGDFGGVQTAPVGSYAASPWRLFDTAGNVQEWVEDCYNSSYQGAPTDGSAQVAEGCAARVARGGSWSNPPDNLRAAKRNGLAPELRQDNLGFRVVRELN